MGSRPERLEFWAVALVGACLCLVTAIVTATGSTSDYAWLEVLARTISVAAPMAVGLYARRRPPFERFGLLLILAGALWFVTTLGDSRDPVLYSIGRVAAWPMELTLVYLVLAFPAGRLPARVDRALVWATAMLVLVLYVPTAFVVEAYPLPAPWTTCHAGCPENAFMVTASEPAVVEEVIRPLREVLTGLLFAAVAVRLALRLRGTSRLARRIYAPVLVVSCLRLAAYGAIIAGRAWAPEAELVEAATWSLALAMPILAGAFLVGLVRWRLFTAEAMWRLAARLRTHPAPEDLRAALADAFDDPSLDIVYRVNDRWVDRAGQPIAVPPPESDRCLTELRDGDELVAAVVHDSVLRDDAAFVDGATSYALMTLDNHRLSVEASALVREVNASRARIQKSADDERRRIERDLHDGAQQRLVALRIKLALSAERLGGDASADVLRGLGDEVDRLLDEVRSLARGIYPSPLADRGVVEALRSAALEATVRTTVVAADPARRYPREIESAVYFSCLEALQNACKHARGASAVVVEISDGSSLRFDVHDDGAGFNPDHVRGGVGLTSIRDRLAAVRGQLSIVSSVGRGTRVIGTIPLEDDVSEPAARDATCGAAPGPPGDAA
jgi:signal transduction histidine kinase